MMGSSDTSQKPFFYSFNLDDVVPQDHLLRSIDRYLDFPICAITWHLITATPDAPQSIPS